MSDSLQPHGLYRQAHFSMEFSRQEYWNGLTFISFILPNLGIEPGSPALQAHSLPSETPEVDLTYNQTVNYMKNNN